MVTAIDKRLTKIRKIYNEFPRQFWILVLGTFIDRLGGALMFPFFTLYLTKKFEIGMTEVGMIFGVFSISSVIGSMIGGAMTDRLGRKGMLIFGLVASATSALLMGLVNEIQLFLLVVILVGTLANAGGPAQEAMVADLLPENKRAEGFGILRVVANLSVTIGPMIGGFLAATSYLLLFASDAAASLITAVIAYFAIKETKAPQPEGEPQESMGETFRGYSKVLRDGAFTWFLVASLLMVLVYMNMNTTLAVYLRDVHGVAEQGFGYILSLNAAMVVLFQFSITRWTSKYRPLIIMTVGTVLYAIGFAMYGFVSTFVMFLMAMAIITIGEMLVTPVSQAIVARLAPDTMRGRYLAVYGFSWVIPFAVGPLLAGLVMDNLDPSWVWYACGIVGLVAALAYYQLEWRVGRSRWSAVDRRIEIIERLEKGEISASEASRQLDMVGEGKWAKLTAPEVVRTASRHLLIRVSDMESGLMKSELRIPLGVVNTVLYVGGQLSPDLEHFDPQELHEKITRSAEENRPEQLENGTDHVEISVE